MADGYDQSVDDMYTPGARCLTGPVGVDERVVVLTHVTAGGEGWDSADVMTFRDGKVVKIQTAGDTAKYEKVFGSS
jgi:ketosteroid isomerase-like protein